MSKGWLSMALVVGEIETRRVRRSIISLIIGYKSRALLLGEFIIRCLLLKVAGGFENTCLAPKHHVRGHI